MKSYTDIEQSKKLAEFLSIESADGFYEAQHNPLTDKWEYILFTGNKWASEEVVIPCWSLSALIELMDECRMERTPLDQTGEFTHSFVDNYFNIRTYKEYELVDAAMR